MITKDLGCYLPRILRDHENSVGEWAAAQGFVDSPPGAPPRSWTLARPTVAPPSQLARKRPIPTLGVRTMDQITIRRTSADLPVFDEEVDLEPVSSLGTDGGSVSDFQFGEASLRALDLKNVMLLRGKIRALRAERANITGVRIDSAEFTGCDLSSLRWAGGKISRVRFDTCKLLGARFEGVTLEHVVFRAASWTTRRSIRSGPPVRFSSFAARFAKWNSPGATWPTPCSTTA